MSDRIPFLAGNWKMHLNRAEAADLAASLRDLVGDVTDRDVALFPPFTALDAVRAAVEGSAIRVGAQCCHFEEKGAFTGEVSAGMLRDAGCELVLVGHSERRQHLRGDRRDGPPEARRRSRAPASTPVLCVGETLEEREAGRDGGPWCERQAVAALEGLTADEMARITVAYEPVWAIGTGLTATPGAGPGRPRLPAGNPGGNPLPGGRRTNENSVRGQREAG